MASHPLGSVSADSIRTSWIGSSASDIRNGLITSPFDIRDVWPSSYSGNTNEILWGAKVGARLPWVTCVIRLTSYECGMDQPTFTPVQQIIEHSGTLFFSFQDLGRDEARRIGENQIETIAYYLERASKGIIASKKAQMADPFPFLQAGPGRGESCLSPLITTTQDTENVSPPHVRSPVGRQDRALQRPRLLAFEQARSSPRAAHRVADIDLTNKQCVGDVPEQVSDMSPG